MRDVANSKRQGRAAVLVGLAAAMLAGPGLAADPPPPAGPATAKVGAAPAVEIPMPKNVLALPKEMTRRQVIDVMKSWTSALGVRCEHCHLDDPHKPLNEWDFAADDKVAKRVAREMVGLLNDTNARLEKVAALREDGSAAPKISCATCHRGLARPRAIEEVVAEQIASDGLETALAAYRTLRAERLVSGSYDFSATPLLRLARTRLAARDAAGATAILTTALDLELDSLVLRLTLAEAANLAGDGAAARAHLEKAASLSRTAEEREFVQKQLDALAPAPAKGEVE